MMSGPQNMNNPDNPVPGPYTASRVATFSPETIASGNFPPVGSCETVTRWNLLDSKGRAALST